MDALRKAAFFEELSNEIDKLTADSTLLWAADVEQWLLRTVFASSPEQESFVLAEATVFAAREDVDLLELYIRLVDEFPDEAREELLKAFAELNFFTPVGAYGIHPERGHVFLRECYKLDNDKDIAELVKDVLVDYEMVLEAMMASYPGLSAIWSGEMTFAETIEKELLRKHSK